MSFEYWFMFPIAIIIATIAMSTLVGGATFFSPLFILILKLEPHVAIATALMTQFFGFSTGLIRYIKQGNIDYAQGTFLLVITIPYAIIGATLSTKINPQYMQYILGVIIMYIAYRLYNLGSIEIKRKGKTLTAINFRKTGKSLKMSIKDLRESVVSTGIGSLFLGMTSAGLGELLGFNWIKKSKAGLDVIVATTVYIIAITTFITSLPHFFFLFKNNINDLYLAKDILTFTIPGVIIGAIIGTTIIKKIDKQLLQKIISVVLMLTGMLCFL